MYQICLIALVGLPSAGKTSFCRAVLRSSIEFNILHVCYDELFTFLPQASSGKTFKGKRATVLQRIDRIVSAIVANEFPYEEVSHWKKTNSDVFVIICDDNHYYAGMRYELYKICRKHFLAFGQIYFPLSLDDALTRNTARTHACLPPEVVIKMFERLEAPSAKNQWEINSLKMAGDIDASAVVSFVNKCLQNPVQPLPELEKAHEKDLNIIHDLDLRLRQKIKAKLQNNTGDLGEKAKQLNERRRNILQEAKKLTDAELDLDYLFKKLLTE